MMFRQFHFELSIDFELSVLQLVFHTFCNDLSKKGTYSSKEEAAARELYFKIMRNSCEVERNFSVPFDEKKETPQTVSPGNETPGNRTRDNLIKS